MTTRLLSRVKALRALRPLQSPWFGVPQGFRELPTGQLELPATLSEWERRRAGIRDIVRECLGVLPARPHPAGVRTIFKKQMRGYTLEKFVFDNAADSNVPGYLALPDRISGRVPAILTVHGHGGCKEQVFGMVDSHHAVAERLARQGYAVVAIDSYCCGERKGSGPEGRRKAWYGRDAEEASLFKLNLWLGRSLWGMMLREQQIVLDYLISRPEIDPNRIGAQGMSMGATNAWWLAALDDRIQAVVAIACLTRYTDLIATRALAAHGLYYFVPGILRHFDMEALLALIAPRPLLLLTGDRDAGSPPTGIQELVAAAAHFYALYGRSQNLQSHVYPRTGHVYTEDMKQRMIGWFNAFFNDAKDSLAASTAGTVSTPAHAT